MFYRIAYKVLYAIAVILSLFIMVDIFLSSRIVFGKETFSFGLSDKTEYIILGIAFVFMLVGMFFDNKDREMLLNN